MFWLFEIMEQHPIPQDVTGFQFKLIGTMTVKQFGYVAFGAILAVLCWYAPLQGIFWQIVTKVILLPIFGISGIVIAFVPIEGRPVDVMTMNFIHALVTPNQYIYIKKGRKFSFTQITYAKSSPVETTTTQKPVSQLTAGTKKEKQLRALLANNYQNAKNNLDQKELAFLQSVTTMPMPASQPITTSMPIPAAPAAVQPASTAGQQQNIQKTDTESHQKVLELQKQTQDINAQKVQVEQELFKLKNQLSVQKSAVEPAALPQQEVKSLPVQDAAHVHNIPEAMTKSAGFSHVSDTPNVVIGIIKDSRGNILPNILVEVKDKDGNPVRAFKTNPLGQFASATPLLNGVYTIELEDPKKQHAFDAIQINANGQIMLPIEIISHDAREELRQALFN